MFPPGLEEDNEILTHSVINILLVVLTRAIRKEKDIKDIQIGKKNIKLKILVENMVICVEYLKQSTKVS